MKKSILAIFISLFLSFLIGVYASAEGTSPEIDYLSIESYPEKTVYGAFESLDKKGLSLCAHYTDGTKEIVSGDKLSVSYNRDNHLRVNDKSVVISYLGKSISLPVTVNPIAYDLSFFEVGDVSTVYNGKYQSLDEILPTIIGLDGIPLKTSVVGGGINAGKYEVSIDFQTESIDYLSPESRVVTIEIKPLEAEIFWENTSFIYDGKSKVPTAYFIDVNGKKTNLSVVGAAINAGNYKARVSVNNPNYSFSSSSIDYVIKKADYDFSGIIWSSDSFVYDGSKKSVTLTGLPSGVTVKSYVGEAQKDAGKYTATAELIWDEVNYNSPPNLSHTWQILPAEYDLSKVSFKSENHIFDGNIHYPTLLGRMPIGKDGIPLEYNFSAGACHVNEGIVSVIISFKTASKNYKTPEPMYSSVSISPKGINVEWSEDELYYTGERITPGASADECEIKVSGGALTVGKYVAKAESTNSDYYVINDTIEFRILKAKNRWITPPTDSTCFEGKGIFLTGKSLFGDMKYRFYLDSEGKNPIETPTKNGRYYARIIVDETMNYDGITSEIIAFDIVEITAISFVAKIIPTRLFAFQKITHKDLVCWVVNNDGSQETVDSAKVNIAYQSGESLRKYDEIVILRYDDFILTLPIEVDYADYDLSGVTWKNSVTTYNGKPQSPIISGLPEGINILGFEGGDMIDAGQYEIKVKLEYDRRNYNEPAIPGCVFIIEKQIVEQPIISTVYNKKDQIPTSRSKIYTVSSNTAYREAGKYTVPITLTDPDNYVFAETSSDVGNAIFEIQPATVNIRIEDTKLRLFERLEKAEYGILGGLLEGDILTLSFFDEAGKIYAESKNPNYVLNVESGRIIRLPYPTLTDGIRLMVIIFIIFLLLFMITLVVKKRNKLAFAFGVLRCRWHHRNFTVSEPKSIEREKKQEVYPEEIIGDEQPKKKIIPDDDALDIDPMIPNEKIDSIRADDLITDSLAKSLLVKMGAVIYTLGSGRANISMTDLSENFEEGEIVDVNALKSRGIIEEDISTIRITDDGALDKPLTVYANEFSLTAVKILALTGGKAIKCITLHGKPKEEKE